MSRDTHKLEQESSKLFSKYIMHTLQKHTTINRWSIFRAKSCIALDMPAIYAAMTPDKACTLCESSTPS
jgi:hypothetical protein